MTLDVFEFIRRFLLHILPAGFVKIRHYGILSNRNHSTKFKKCREYLGLAVDKAKPKVKLSWEELLYRLTGVNPRSCPVCKQGRMEFQEILNTNKTYNIKWLIALKIIRDNLTQNGKLAIESP